jgi:hypothetical protein
MEGALGSGIISKEEFRKLYEQNNGFTSRQSRNHSAITDGSLSSFFIALEDGCDLLIKTNPELVEMKDDE